MSQSNSSEQLFEGLSDLASVPVPKIGTGIRFIHVNFRKESDVAEYAKVINRSLTPKTKELHFPSRDDELSSLFDFGQTASYEAPRSRNQQDIELDSEIFELEHNPEFYDLHWNGMPQFIQKDAGAVRKITHFFKTEEDVKSWAKLIGQNITKTTNSIWFPYRPKNDSRDIYWRANVNNISVNPRFPLYIPTKGRADSRLTSKALNAMGVPHYLVVEEQEYDQYVAAAAGTTATVIILDPLYKQNYELCDDLGLTKSTGPGPARNFAWDHSISNGFDYHWVMDDNINEFLRLHENRKIRFGDGSCFRMMEDWVLRYSNVVMAGPQYRAFAPQNAALPPFVLNTRIYSCNLIKNNASWRDGRVFRWRGRYNEDTILSLDMLVEGYCTVQFNNVLQDKLRTQVLGGGNTGEFYAKEGTYNKSRMLWDVYPQYTKLTWKFQREHHEVNYRPFKVNQLQFADGYDANTTADDYSLTLHDGWKAKRAAIEGIRPDQVQIHHTQDPEDDI